VGAPSTITQATSSFVAVVLLSSHLHVVALHLTTSFDEKTLRNPALSSSSFNRIPRTLTTRLNLVAGVSRPPLFWPWYMVADTSSTGQSAMVTTRRSGANAAPIPYVPLRPSKRRKVTVTNISDQLRYNLLRGLPPRIRLVQARFDQAASKTDLLPTHPPTAENLVVLQASQYIHQTKLKPSSPPNRFWLH
jgi:hypothetical protein